MRCHSQVFFVNQCMHLTTVFPHYFKKTDRQLTCDTDIHYLQQYCAKHTDCMTVSSGYVKEKSKSQLAH